MPRVASGSREKKLNINTDKVFCCNIIWSNVYQDSARKENYEYDDDKLDDDDGYGDVNDDDYDDYDDDDGDDDDDDDGDDDDDDGVNDDGDGNDIDIDDNDDHHHNCYVDFDKHDDDINNNCCLKSFDCFRI